MKQFPSPNTQDSSQSGFLNQAVIVVFVLVTLLLIGGYFYFNSSNGGVSVEVNLSKEVVYPGDILDMDVVLLNNSQAALQNVRLTLNFPERIRLLDNKDRVN